MKESEPALKEEVKTDKSPLGRLFLSEYEKVEWMRSKGIEPSKPHPIAYFQGVKKYKSVWRAIRKGKISVDGTVFPRRPFNNRKPTRGRSMETEKRRLYEEFKTHIS